MSEKDIFYQFLGREIDNMIAVYVPSLNLLSGAIKNYIFNIINPYVDLFFIGGTDSGKLNVRAAGEFAKQEVNEKIKNFIDKYEKENKDNSY
jgi:hypothetical protein